MTEAQIRYQQYLQSDHWRQLRLKAFRHYGRKCIRCSRTNRLEVHHMVYRHPWESALIADLQILCRGCHCIIHGMPIGEVMKREIERGAKKQRRRLQKLIRERQRREAKIRQINKSTVYFYTKPYSKRPGWTNRGTSSN